MDATTITAIAAIIASITSVGISYFTFQQKASVAELVRLREHVLDLKDRLLQAEEREKVYERRINALEEQRDDLWAENRELRFRGRAADD